MFHLLIIDDDKNTRFLLKEVFETEHYTVKTAADGKQALALLDGERFDLARLLRPHLIGRDVGR